VKKYFLQYTEEGFFIEEGEVLSDTSGHYSIRCKDNLLVISKEKAFDKKSEVFEAYSNYLSESIFKIEQAYEEIRNHKSDVERELYKLKENGE
jgi:hypothetical protein